MTHEDFVEWIDEALHNAEQWKKYGENPDKTIWNEQIRIFTAVKEKFFTLTPPPTTLS